MDVVYWEIQPGRYSATHAVDRNKTLCGRELPGTTLWSNVEVTCGNCLAVERRRKLRAENSWNLPDRENS